MNDFCPLCKRELVHPSDHHLIPKSRGGKETVTICVDCHRAIHARFDTKILDKKYNTVESLLADEQLAGTFKFISKQSPTRIMMTKTSKQKRRRAH